MLGCFPGFGCVFDGGLCLDSVVAFLGGWFDFVCCSIALFAFLV